MMKNIFAPSRPYSTISSNTELMKTTSPAYSAVSKSWNTKADAVTITASVSRKREPVFRWGKRSRRSLMMMSVPPVVAPALNTSPRDTAIRDPPTTAASSGSAVTAPTDASRLVKKEVAAVQ